MALSNWDTYAVGFEVARTYAPKSLTDELQKEAAVKRAAGEGPGAVDSWYQEEISKYQDLSIRTLPSNGSFTSSLGVSADIYKNWIYLRSPELWREGCGFIEPTIGEFSEGRVRVGGLELTAWRGPQNGIYAVVEETVYGKRSDDAPWLITRRGMLGVGCSGYEDFSIPRSWKRVQAATCFNDTCDWVLPLGDYEDRDLGRTDYPKSCPECDADTRLTDFEPTDNDSYIWCGVKSTSLKWFRNKLSLELTDEELEQVDLMAGERYNQGDAFFAGQFGIDTPASKPGESEEPMITDALKGMAKRLEAEKDE